MPFNTPALLAAGLLLSYFIISKIRTFIEARRFAKAHGCKQEKRLPQWERIIGYDFFKLQQQNAQKKVMLMENLKRFREYGNTWSLTIMGRHAIATIEPENVKAILATNFSDFGIGKRMEALGPFLGSGIFTADGAHWEHSRALVRPNFAKQQVADLDNFESHILEVIKKIPRDGSTVELQPLFFQLTFDSATEFLFGESTDILRSPPGSEQQLFAASFDKAQLMLSDRTRLGPFVRFTRNTEFNEHCKRVHNFVDKFVVKALEYRRQYDADEKAGVERGPERYIFMHQLAKATTDAREIRDQILNIFLAGRDTTAGLLSNTFHTLARRPDIWNKLMVEVDELRGKRPDYETLRNMKYLKFVLNEALRLFPSVPGNTRFAIRNTTIPVGGGPDGKSPIFVPKGTPVSYGVFSMHRRKDIYGEDADEFKPERWESLRVGWGYLPFNGGPRICVGQQFALTEASYTIVRLMQEFKAVESRDTREEWLEQIGLTLSSGTPVAVSFTPKV